MRPAMSAACPPRPSVQSTTVWPGRGSRCSSVSTGRTGSCPCSGSSGGWLTREVSSPAPSATANLYSQKSTSHIEPALPPSPSPVFPFLQVAGISGIRRDGGRDDVVEQNVDEHARHADVEPHPEGGPAPAGVQPPLPPRRPKHRDEDERQHHHRQDDVRDEDRQVKRFQR